MITTHNVLIVAAVVCFIIAAVPVTVRPNLIAAGLALFSASFLV